MRWQQLLLRSISEGVSLAKLPLPPKQGLRILSYHSIGSYTYGDKLGLNTVSIARFMQDLDIVATMQSVPLTSIEISQTAHRVSITFDDGYADNLYVAAPLLVARNIPFTVFIATDFVKKREKGFLRHNELQQLSKVSGATIGAHSSTHCNLTLCSNHELRAELEDSKHYLEDLLGMYVTTFAYPYGQADMRVREAVQRAGYEVGVCSRFDINRPSRDAFMLNRCVILRSDTARIVRQKLIGNWDWYRLLSADPLTIRPSL
jgi:peptidoglycan/xylan/chitin deacetylase (PgdA/CDA1 family)